MSGNINNSRASKGKGIGRKGERASEANRKLMENVLRDGIDEDEMRFSQIQKIYGNGWFGIKLSDGRETKAMIRDLLASKKGTPVAIGTVVLAHLPDWKKDELTKNQKPRAFIEGVLEDIHVHLLKHRGVLPEWMGLIKSAEGEEEKKDDGYVFVSEEATKLIALDDEDEDEDTTTNAVIVPTISATASRAQTKKTRELAISSARDKKEDFNIDNI
jgi:hypothetical protein